MAKKSSQIQQLIQPVIEAMGYELFGVEYAGHGDHGVLRIYIEQPEGITLDDCAKVSEQVSAILDVEDPIAGKYTLEVSSPGIERPLFTLEHFQRYVGHYVHIRTFVPVENQRNFSGVIESVDGNNVILNVEGKTLSLPFESITKANLRFEGKMS